MNTDDTEFKIVKDALDLESRAPEIDEQPGIAGSMPAGS